jgi:hypothetical protein
MKWVISLITGILSNNFCGAPANAGTNSVGVQSEGEAEGGCGGNSASPPPEADRRSSRSLAALLPKSRPPKKSFVFLLKEKIGRAQNKNCEQNFSLSERAQASGGVAERQNSASGFSRKKVRISFRVWSQIVCSAFVGASAGRLYSICQDFFGSIATFCESKTRFAVAKQRANESLRANPFYSAEGGKQSDNF